MRREGYIRSIGVCNNFPKPLLEKAIVECGFSIQTTIQCGNILFPPPTTQTPLQSSPSSSSLLIPNQWLVNSLAGGLLTDQFVNWIDPPTWHSQWGRTVQTWGELQGIPPIIISTNGEKKKQDAYDLQLWNSYKEHVLHVLQDMAWRYGVSIKSIVLRWALESDEGTSSVIVPAFNGDLSSSSSSSAEWRAHIRELRGVFTFTLEEEDRKILLKLSRAATTKRVEEEEEPVLDLLELEELLVRQGLPENEIEVLLEQHNQQLQSSTTTSASDFPKIDFGNSKLWL